MACVVLSDPSRLRAAAEALGEFGDPVALCPPDSIWIDVTGLPERPDAIRARIDQMGLFARIAFADTPFLARVFALHPGRRIEDIPIAAAELNRDITTQLKTLGIRTLADLGSLPLPSLTMRFGATLEAIWRGARGEPGAPLVRFEPPGAIVESLDLEAPVETLETLRFSLKTLLDRTCARLHGRGVGATAIRLELRPDGGEPVPLLLDLAAPLADVPLLHALLIERLARIQLGRPLIGLELEVLRTAPRLHTQLDLFAPPAPREDPGVTLSRVAAAAGDPPRAARLRERYRPEQAFTLEPFRPDARPAARGAPPPPAPRPTRLLVEPRRIVLDLERVVLSGPERLVGDWWTEEPLARDYYVVRMDDGRAWVFHELSTGNLYLHGYFD